MGSPLIDIRHVVKTFTTSSVSYTALKGVDLTVGAGEFVAIIGKSGSGKSTLINMVTGIDRPTAGEVWVSGTPVHTLSEGKLAEWRGRNLGVIFQFFQLLPTLTLLENVMLPMDFCRMYTPKEREKRALELLDLVGMAEHAHKMPSAVSGGQQQRVAIARSMANDPPIIVADEPTGSLDSKAANAVFGIFERLVAQGKTVVMVTHDNDLASRVSRSVIVADGEIVNQYVVNALRGLDLDQMTALQRRFERVTVPPGTAVVHAGAEADKAYIITKGEVEVLLPHPSGRPIPVARLGPGQYFGEIALLRGGPRTATVCATLDSPVELMALDREALQSLVVGSDVTRADMDQVVRERLTQLAALGGQP